VLYLSALKYLFGGEDNRHTVFIISPTETYFSLSKNLPFRRTAGK